MNEYFEKYNYQQLINLRENYRGTPKHGEWFIKCVEKMLKEVSKLNKICKRVSVIIITYNFISEEFPKLPRSPEMSIFLKTIIYRAKIIIGQILIHIKHENESPEEIEYLNNAIINISSLQKTIVKLYTNLY